MKYIHTLIIAQLAGIALQETTLEAQRASSESSAFCGNDLFENETSNTFIVRWAFQNMCDHVFDPRTNKFAWPTTTKQGGVSFNPKEVKAGDIIFVRDIEYFFEKMHRHINNPYVIVTHGEFRDTTQEHHLEFLEDDKIIAWFAIHPSKRGHEKYYPIPLGLMQDKKYYDQKHTFNQFLQGLRDKPKRKMLYMNFDADRNPERQKVKKLLADKDYCFNRKEPVAFTEYLEEMAEFKFALSPRGWGPDCYRTWEALFVGTIPIVRRCVADMIVFPKDAIRSYRPKCSQLDELYIDLPILVIDNWKEITEEFLEKKFIEITSKKYDLRKLYLEYWQNKIRAVRDAYLTQQDESTRALSKRRRQHERKKLEREEFEQELTSLSFEKAENSTPQLSEVQKSEAPVTLEAPEFQEKIEHLTLWQRYKNYVVQLFS